MKPRLSHFIVAAATAVGLLVTKTVLAATAKTCYSAAVITETSTAVGTVQFQSVTLHEKRTHAAQFLCAFHTKASLGVSINDAADYCTPEKHHSHFLNTDPKQNVILRSGPSVFTFSITEACD